jgi:hypothetical protein
MPRVQLEDAIYSMFLPLNDNKYPVMELVRTALVSSLFNPETAPKQGTFIKERFPGDSIGQEAGEELDFTAQSLAGFRILDLINKTDLRCFFISGVEWFKEYPTEGTKRLRVAVNVAESLREKIEKRGKKELYALECTPQTVDSIFEYYKSNNPVDVASSVCAMTLLACLSNAGNKRLDRT